MLPTVAVFPAPFTGLNDDSKFCAELFLRMVGRDNSVIGGLLGGRAAWKTAAIVSENHSRNVDNPN
jgi:hypothetical protein